MEFVHQIVSVEWLTSTAVLWTIILVSMLYALLEEDKYGED